MKRSILNLKRSLKRLNWETKKKMMSFMTAKTSGRNSSRDTLFTAKMIKVIARTRSRISIRINYN